MYRSLRKTVKPPHCHWTKACGENLTHQIFILRVNSHSLVKVAHMFNMVSLTIVDGEGRLVEMARELSLLDMLRKWRARYLKESFTHGIIPLTPPWWGSKFLTMMPQSWSMLGRWCEWIIGWSPAPRSITFIIASTWVLAWRRSPVILHSRPALKTST